MREKFDERDIMDVMAGVSIVWSKLELGMRDNGPTVSLGLTFENPTPLTVEGIDGIEVYLALEGTNFVQFVIERVQLSEGLQDIALKIEINFVAPGIQTKEVSFLSD